MAGWDFAQERVWDFWGRGGWELRVRESSEGMGQVFRGASGWNFRFAGRKKIGVVDSRVCWVFGDLVSCFCGEVVVKCVAKRGRDAVTFVEAECGTGFSTLFFGARVVRLFH